MAPPGRSSPVSVSVHVNKIPKLILCTHTGGGNTNAPCPLSHSYRPLIIHSRLVESGLAFAAYCALPAGQIWKRAALHLARCGLPCFCGRPDLQGNRHRLRHLTPISPTFEPSRHPDADSTLSIPIVLFQATVGVVAHPKNPSTILLTLAINPSDPFLLFYLTLQPPLLRDVISPCWAYETGTLDFLYSCSVFRVPHPVAFLIFDLFKQVVEHRTRPNIPVIPYSFITLRCNYHISSVARP